MAWWKGLGGVPFEPDLTRVVNANRKAFEELGCIVEDAEPDFTGVAEAERNTGADVARAAARQAHLHVQAQAFFEKYEYFVLPVTQVEPFDVATPYPVSVAGTAMPTYIDWMRSCWYVTFMASPAISVPAGFTASGPWEAAAGGVTFEPSLASR